MALFSFYFLIQAKAYRDYAVSKKSLDLLTEEDRFMYRLSYTERLATKLNVMHYIGNFFDNIHLITPVCHYPLCVTDSTIDEFFLSFSIVCL